MMMASEWINRTEYPFQPHFLEVADGRMHYVDEGRGAPVVMVHGTPTWSFLYRRLIARLTDTHRVVAPDHIGFGLSDKPREWSARPEDHARNLETLIERLRLEGVTLVVHDFGGPVGLSYAIKHPANVSRLVLFNTWMWSLAGDKAITRGSRLFGGALGRVLYKNLNFSPRVLMRSVMGDKSKLTPEAHRHYTAAFPTRRDRHAPWALARELTGSGGWYESLWRERGRIEAKPALLLWGMKDPAFGPDYLQRWKGLFIDAEAVEFPAAGHFVQEEEGANLVPIIRNFLK